MAAIKNISDGQRIVSWVSNGMRSKYKVLPGEIVKDVPDQVALKKILKSIQSWAPADEYTKKLVSEKFSDKYSHGSGYKLGYKPGRTQRIPKAKKSKKSSGYERGRTERVAMVPG